MSNHNSKKVIAIVEDEVDIRELVIYGLETAQFECTGYENGAELYSALSNSKLQKPDLLLLDIMLPDNDGFQILKRLRSNVSTAKLPVIMLTAKSSEHDKVKGLNLGADDYLTKPFGITELIARINAVLRRIANPNNNAKSNLNYESISLDTERRNVTVNNEPIILTYREFELLQFLLLNKGIVLSRDKIMDTVWGVDYESESRTVDIHIKTLRQKLGVAGEYIKTFRNVGYKLGD